VAVFYVLDGTRTETLEDFYSVVGEAVNGPGGYFGRNLDAFGDCLSGGFGTPEGDDFCFVWENADAARVQLGYEETARQLRMRLKRCHPTNRESVARELAEAEAGRGPTVFDWLVQIFDERGHPVELRK
jgi:RNAse (barnase) inhibitor barstar